MSVELVRLERSPKAWKNSGGTETQNGQNRDNPDYRIVRIGSNIQRSP